MRKPTTEQDDSECDSGPNAKSLGLATPTPRIP